MFAGLFFFMSTIPRLTTTPFPGYIFIPGKNPHPKKDGGHMAGLPDPIATPIDLIHPEKSQELRYSIDLYNHGYFWESHVYFEALWNAHGRQGSVADLMKAFIKLGAAGVKDQINQKTSALGHLVRAKELLEAVTKAEAQSFLGFELKEMASEIDSAIECETFKIVLNPEWGSQ